LKDLEVLRNQAAELSSGPIIELPEDSAAESSAVVMNGSTHTVEDLGSSFIAKEQDTAGGPPMFRGISFLSDADPPRPVVAQSSAAAAVGASKPQVEIETHKKGTFRVLSPTEPKFEPHAGCPSRPVSTESSPTMSADEKYQRFLSTSYLNSHNRGVGPGGILGGGALTRPPTHLAENAILGGGALTKQSTLTSSGLFEDSSIGPALTRGSSLDYWGIRNIPIDAVDFSAVDNMDNTSHPGTARGRHQPATAVDSSVPEAKSGMKRVNYKSATNSQVSTLVNLLASIIPSNPPTFTPPAAEIPVQASDESVQKRPRLENTASSAAVLETDVVRPGSPKSVRPAEYLGLLQRKQEVRTVFAFASSVRCRLDIIPRCMTVRLRCVESILCSWRWICLWMKMAIARRVVTLLLQVNPLVRWRQ
jgi:hypothetical protein